mmetsp:Transcript_104686/g.249255  ORF Transcript_104686/g.249255 Transcript_104686/m.249255 type:complete len:224 (+) Transcript_104686:69-740(+)
MIATPRTNAPNSARNRESRLLAGGRLVLGAHAEAGTNSVPPKAEANQDQDEVDFRQMRKQVKQQQEKYYAERRPSRTNSQKPENIISEVPLSARSLTRGNRATAVTAAAVLGGQQLGGVGVDPIYFDYGAATRKLREKAQAEKEGQMMDDPAAAKTREMVTFLTSQGLSGPIRAYAKALALQGVTEPRTLIESDAPRLSKMLNFAEFECTDELLLLDALRQLR